ncbi:SH3 domain-containing protein [Streptomyces sp. NPDC050147]|uniref:SH3 domain-containing protein n=1 Tax=Streptomyces sp. NPDC050147 TaxID=3155513 RepID=UPI003446D10C
MHASSARIRRVPSLRADVLGMLYRDHVIRVHRSHNGWVHLTNTASGVTGWTSGDLVYRAGGACTG